MHVTALVHPVYDSRDWYNGPIAGSAVNHATYLLLWTCKPFVFSCATACLQCVRLVCTNPCQCCVMMSGPLFQGHDQMDFYNLELADTNVVDHNTHDYSTQGLVFEVVDK